MREALAGLTLRGRAFLAAGITAIACAVILGQPALNRVGVMILALPLITALVLGRSRYRLALTRSVSPALVSAGNPARVDLVLTNEGRTPSGVLLLEDQVPYVLGTRPRFVLEGIGHGWKRNVTYQIRSDVRGRFEIGPMSVRVSDPFGLVELGRSFRTTASLTVTPRTIPLPAVPLGGGWTGSGDNRPRAFATGSAEDVTVRDYRRGDDLRRVHWRSSARTGELMVRREEQPWQAKATIFVDNRAIAHRGKGIASSLETAVSAAASIAVHLTKRGFTVRLVTAAGEDSSTASLREGQLGAGPILESLAVLGTTPSTHLDTSWLTDRNTGGLTVAIVGRIDPSDLPFIRRIRRNTGTAMALALDVGQWQTPERQPSDRLPSDRQRSQRAGSPPTIPPDTTALLAAARWRVATVGPGDRLDSVWSQLGKLGGAGGGPVPPASSGASEEPAAASEVRS